MRRIIYAIFLTLILVVQCMTGSHKCNISGGDFTICVCTNRSGIQCSIKGISIPLNETTTKERKCLQNVHNLGQKSKTCLCSQLCHTNERVARYRDTCASQAVRTITQTFTQFVTLCCKAQRVLIELYFTLEKEAFKELLTSITSISTRTLPSYLTTTKWCRAFPLKCVELATVLQKHCKHLQNRERRNLKEETPSNTTTKQINSTSNAGYEGGHLQHTSSLLSTSKQTMQTLPQKISSTSRTISYESTVTSTPLLQGMSSVSSKPQPPKTIKHVVPLFSTVYSSSISTSNLVSIEPKPTYVFVSKTLRKSESTAISDGMFKQTKEPDMTSKAMFSEPVFAFSSLSDSSIGKSSVFRHSKVPTQSSLQLSATVRPLPSRSPFDDMLSSSSTSLLSQSSQSTPSLLSFTVSSSSSASSKIPTQSSLQLPASMRTSRSSFEDILSSSSSSASLKSAAQSNFLVTRSTVAASLSEELSTVTATVLSEAFPTPSLSSLTSSLSASLKSTAQSFFVVSKSPVQVSSASPSEDLNVITVSSNSSSGYIDHLHQSQQTVSSSPQPSVAISRSTMTVLSYDKLVTTTNAKQNQTIQLASSSTIEPLDVVKTSLGIYQTSRYATRSLSKNSTVVETVATSRIDDGPSDSKAMTESLGHTEIFSLPSTTIKFALSSVLSTADILPSTTAGNRTMKTVATSRIDDGPSDSKAMTESLEHTGIFSLPSTTIKLPLSSVLSTADMISPSTTAGNRTMKTVATSRIDDGKSSSTKTESLEYTEILPSSLTSSLSSISSSAHITPSSPSSTTTTVVSTTTTVVSTTTTTTTVNVNGTGLLSTMNSPTPSLTNTASRPSNQENTMTESALLPSPSVLSVNASSSWLKLKPGISETKKTKQQTASRLLTSSLVSESSLSVFDAEQTKNLLSKGASLSIRSRNTTEAQATVFSSSPTVPSPSLMTRSVRTASSQPSILVSLMLSSSMGTVMARSTPYPVASFTSKIRSSLASNQTEMKSSLYLMSSLKSPPTIPSQGLLSTSSSTGFSSSSTLTQLTSILVSLAPSLSTSRPKRLSTLSLSSVSLKSSSDSSLLVKVLMSSALHPKSMASLPSLPTVSLPRMPPIQSLSSVSEDVRTSAKVDHLQTPFTTIMASSSLPKRAETASYFIQSKLTRQVKSSSESLLVSHSSIITPSNVHSVMTTSSVVLPEDHKETFLILFEGTCPGASEHRAFKTAFLATIRRLIAIESSLIDVLAIQCGSIKVVFSIKCEKSSKIPEILDDLVAHGHFRVTMNGTIFKAVNITEWEPPTPRPNLTSTPQKDHPSVHAKVPNQRRAIMIIFVLFASIFAALSIFGIVICIARLCGRKPYGRLKLYSSTLSTRGTNQLYKNELELVRMSPLHHGADYYGGRAVNSREDCADDDDDKIDNRTALLNRLRNDEVASRRGKIIVKDDDSYSSIIFY